MVSDRPVQQAMVSGLREVIERCLTKQWPSFESKHGGKIALGQEAGKRSTSCTSGRVGILRMHLSWSPNAATNDPVDGAARAGTDRRERKR